MHAWQRRGAVLLVAALGLVAFVDASVLAVQNGSAWYGAKE